jgi:integral membrane protein (TIGR01906 family)
MTSRSDQLIGLVAGIATPIVIVAAAVLLFLNPLWVGFEQGRSAVTSWTGYSATQVSQVTGSILSDLVFGPPRFAVRVNGSQVLDPREIGHMVDVRNVMTNLGALALLALLALVVAAVAGWRKRALWRGIQLGARVLAVGVVVVGVLFTLFFDQAFLLFHDVFFSPGTFSFDPTTERLVQLFPDQFWSDTTIALAAVVLALACAVTVLAGRRASAAGEPALAAPVAEPQPRGAR